MSWMEELNATAPDAPEVVARPNAEDVVHSLAKLSALEYDQRREQAAQRLGVRVTTLDGEVQRYRGELEVQDAGCLFPVVQPWKDPVDGAELLDDLIEAIQCYVILEDQEAEAVALWILFAWAFDAWTIAPMLQITAPERACGKSRLLEVVGLLVPRPLPTGSISTAATFRVIEAHQPTLLVDEVETFLPENPELTGVLNNGYLRRQAHVIRCQGDDHHVKTFKVWAPKALCGIGELTDTLASRCITIAMRRKKPSEEVERLRADRQEWAEVLCAKCFRWADDTIDRLRNADPEIPDQLDDRSQDNWRPLCCDCRCCWFGMAISRPRSGCGDVFTSDGAGREHWRAAPPGHSADL